MCVWCVHVPPKGPCLALSCAARVPPPPCCSRIHNFVSLRPVSGCRALLCGAVRMMAAVYPRAASLAPLVSHHESRALAAP